MIIPHCDRNQRIIITVFTSTMQSIGSPMYCLAVTNKVAIVNTITEAYKYSVTSLVDSKC